MTALYLLEPEPPGRRLGALRRRAADRRAPRRRLADPGALGSGAAASEATAILGDHVDGVHRRRTSRRCRPPAAIDGPAVVAASWFAPTGRSDSALDRRGDVRRLTHGGATVGWVVPAGERWERPARAGATRSRSTACCSAARFDLVTALERLLAEDCADFRAAPSHRRPRRQPRAGRSGRRDRAWAPRSSRASCSTSATARSCSTTGSRSATAPGSKARSTSGRAPSCWAGSSGRSVVRTRVPGPRRDRRQRLPGLRQQEPRRLRRPQRAGPLGQPRRAAPRPPISRTPTARSGWRSTASGSRPAGSTSARLFGDHAKTAIGTMLATGTVIGAGANVFGPPTPPKYVPPFAWGSAGDERMTADGFLRDRRAGHAPARRSS